MATVNKNFRIKQGLIVEGTTGTINGQNILTETGGDSYILNLVGGATLVKSVEATQLEVSGAGKLSVKSGVFDASGAAAAAQSAAEATAASDASAKANAAQSAAITAAATDATTKVAAEAALRVSGDAASVSTAAADATTKADAAQAAAISASAADATTKANAAQAAAEATAAADATTKANAAKSAAEATAAAALTSAISLEVSNRNTAISTAVDGLVDGAPALLNTLNELAAAINDDANYTTTITTALGTKAPLASPALTGVPTAPTAAANTDTTQIATTAFAKAEADAAQAAAEATASADATSKVAAEAALRVSGDAASVSTAAADATSKANAAQAAAISAAATDATTKANAAQAAAESTAAAANTAQQNGTTSFTAINYNDVAKQVAATTGNIVTAAATTAISWVAADYRSAKFVVKVKNGVHTQVSDLVVTLDTANNVAVSEYGITYSNGTELAAVTADYSGSDVRIRVTPANANTEVVVVGTLIK